MSYYNLGNNCYRAILAQVNCLDSIWPDKNSLKELYEELSVLAFYMLEQDHMSITKSINQISCTVDEMEAMLPGLNPLEHANMIFSELKTHLDFLLMEYDAGR